MLFRPFIVIVTPEVVHLDVNVGNFFADISIVSKFFPDLGASMTLDKTSKTDDVKRQNSAGFAIFHALYVYTLFLTFILVPE